MKNLLFALLSICFCGNLVAAGGDVRAVRPPRTATLRIRRDRRRNEDDGTGEAIVETLGERTLRKAKVESREAAYDAARECAEKTGGMFFRNRDTGSMEPLFNAYVYVVAVPVKAADEVRIGDIVVFRRDDGVRTMHRVIQKLPRERFITQGDALAQPDDPFSFSQIVGRVDFSFHFPADGTATKG